MKRLLLFFILFLLLGSSLYAQVGNLFDDSKEYREVPIKKDIAFL